MLRVLVADKHSGRKPSINPQLRAEILQEATRPPKGRTRWSTRTMAKAKGGNQTVHKISRANNSKRRLTREFTQDCTREGSLGSVQELVQAITDYLAERPLEPEARKFKAE